MVRLEAESWAGGGRAVARTEGKVWFVAGALPGEVVEAEVERQRAGIVEARTVSVLRASGERERQPCPVVGTCGGCDLGHVAPGAVAKALRAAVIGALRHAPPELAERVAQARIVPSPPLWRLRARLHWDPATESLGFLGLRSHTVVRIDPCRVVSARLLDLLPALERALAAVRAPAGEVEWLEDLAGEAALAGWRGRLDLPRIGGLAGWWSLGRGAGSHLEGWGENGVTMRLPVPLWVPLGAFFQGNRHLTPLLFDRVGGLVAESRCTRVVDLYGGVGLLAAAAHWAGAREVTVVEPSGMAARAAARNLPDCRVFADSAERFLIAPPPARGTLAILDPPRIGLSAEVRAQLARWEPDRLLMLSCDAARFGRDAADLISAEYVLDGLELWDLFSGSHHVEILASFAR